MNYEDFPILDNTTYKIMREQYKLETIDKHELVAGIFNTLNSLCFSEIQQNKHFNKNLKLSLETSKNEITTIINDFSKTFSMKQSVINNIKTRSIFDYLHQILSIIDQIRNLKDLLNKTYHKTIINNSISHLTRASIEILSALNNSTIHFFRYM